MLPPGKNKGPAWETVRLPHGPGSGGSSSPRCNVNGHPDARRPYAHTGLLTPTANRRFRSAESRILRLSAGVRSVWKRMGKI